MSDFLYNAAEFYKNSLLYHKFVITFSKDFKSHEISVVFGAEHFKHLFGLHKLTDLENIRKTGSQKLLQSILDKNITLKDIEKSACIGDLSERLCKYQEVRKVFESKSLFFKSTSDFFKGMYFVSNQYDNYMMTDKIAQEGATCFFMSKSKDKEILEPRSFFVGNSKKFVNNAYFLKIQSIKEILTDGTVLIRNFNDDGTTSDATILPLDRGSDVGKPQADNGALKPAPSVSSQLATMIAGSSPAAASTSVAEEQKAADTTAQPAATMSPQLAAMVAGTMAQAPAADRTQAQAQSKKENAME